MTDFMLGINLASLLAYETQPGSLLGMSSQWFETSILVLFLVGGNIKLKCTWKALVLRFTVKSSQAGRVKLLCDCQIRIVDVRSTPLGFF